MGWRAGRAPRAWWSSEHAWRPGEAGLCPSPACHVCPWLLLPRSREDGCQHLPCCDFNESHCTCGEKASLPPMPGPCTQSITKHHRLRPRVWTLISPCRPFSSGAGDEPLHWFHSHWVAVACCWNEFLCSWGSLGMKGGRADLSYQGVKNGRIIPPALLLLLHPHPRPELPVDLPPDGWPWRTPRVRPSRAYGLTEKPRASASTLSDVLEPAEPRGTFTVS